MSVRVALESLLVEKATSREAWMPEDPGFEPAERPSRPSEIVRRDPDAHDRTTAENPESLEDALRIAAETRG